MTDDPKRLDINDTEIPGPPPPRKLKGDKAESTLVSIEAHSDKQQPVKEIDPSVTDSLRKVKGQKPKPKAAPLQATMYEPTRPGAPQVGSTDATQFGPTTQGAGAGKPRKPGTGPLPTASGSGGQPVAPFGGRIMVGTRVGQIEIKGVLGKGGMGEVFRGYHHALDIEVAVKVLPDELSRNELVRQRFLREARLCVKLDHPNIVRVYNVDEHAGNLFLVMEIIEGTDAANMLKNGGRFKYRRALEIGAACADALAYAQSQGLVHRDVKPHNILLGRDDGKIKLSDFGLARAATSNSHLTMSGQIMGTPHYMSPEQAEAKEVTDKSDVYSLGVTLYHMLTGETPFVGDTPISVAVQHIAKEILYPEARFRPFPSELVAVLKRMTAKDQSKRCSAKQAAVWLRKLISIAPSEDIQAEPDAMQTLAPVVRESQAFEAAAKQREAQDEHAREAARTMLATVREHPQVEAQPTPGSSQMAAAPARSGGGKWAAVAVLLLLLGGGGAAGWYFTIGPGGKPVAPPVIANENSAANSSANSNDPSGQSNQVPDVPDVADDAAFAQRLSDAQEALARAKSTADLAAASQALDLANMEKPRASPRQVAQLEELAARLESQSVYFKAQDHIATMRLGVQDYRAQKDKDMRRALPALNRAMIALLALQELTIPKSVEPLIATERQLVTTDVRHESDLLDSALSAQATKFESELLYDKADEALAPLSELRYPAPRAEEIRVRRWELQTRARHANVLSRLELAKRDDSQYRMARQLLDECETATVPPALQDQHSKVSRAYNDALTARFDALLAQSTAATEAGDFATARTRQGTAKDLPLGSDQVASLRDAEYGMEVREHLHLAGVSADALDFNQAKTNLDEALKKLDNPGESRVPAGLRDQYDRTVQMFDQKLASHFAQLLEVAGQAVQARNFTEAGRHLVAAGELPLTNPQKEALGEFKLASEAAMGEYVGQQIDIIRKALDEGNFEIAREAMQRAKAVSVGDRAGELEELDARFRSEALRRHTEKLDEGERALTRKQYDVVARALQEMPGFPVEGPRRELERDLATRYKAALRAELDKRIEASDALLNQGSLKDAMAQLEAARQLPLDDDMKGTLQRKFDALAARVSTDFDELLRKAAEARERKMFDDSAALLARAATELPLTTTQQGKLSEADDAHRTELAAHIDTLFKDLEDCVQRGDESGGLKVVEVLQKFKLSRTQEDRMKYLKHALSGETPEARAARMPEHLQKFPSDTYLRAEQTFKVGEPITAVYATPDGRYGAIGTERGTVIFYNLLRNVVLGKTEAGNRPITAIAINSAGNMAVAGNAAEAVVLFTLTAGSVQAFPLEDMDNDVTGAEFSLDSRVLYVLSYSGTVRRYNPETRGTLNSTDTKVARAQALALSPDGTSLAVGGRYARVAVMDAQRMVLRGMLQGPDEEEIKRLGFTADSRTLAGGSWRDGVNMWSLEKLDPMAKPQPPVRTFKGLDRYVLGVGFSADGKRLVAIENTQLIKVWDASSGQEFKSVEVAKLSEATRGIEVLSSWIAPDGTMLVGLSTGELVHLTVRSAGD